MGKVIFLANKTFIREALGLPVRVNLIMIEPQEDKLGHGWDLISITVDDPDVPDGNYNPIFHSSDGKLNFLHWGRRIDDAAQ